MTNEAKAIEFKAGSLTVMNVILRDLKHETIAHSLNSLFGDGGENFDNDATVLDLGQLGNVPESMDWSALTTLLRRYGLQVAALKNTPDSLLDSAHAAGLVLLPKAPPRPGMEPPPSSPQASQTCEGAHRDLDFQPAKESAEPVAFRPESTPTKVIDRMVRSGQQIYARGGDLILLNGVSPGAEVIADGSIHCYGPLRGRAIAGAQGTTSARIFSSNFGPELISIAGIYRNFESGIPEKVASRAAQALLKANPVPKDQNKPKTSGEQFALHLEPIQLN